MPEIENAYIQQEQERLNRLAEKLEQLSTPREISIQSIIYMEQLHKAVDQLSSTGEELLKTKRSLDDMEEQRDMYKRLFYTYLDEVVALQDKLSAIQAIINPDQTQESE